MLTCNPVLPEQSSGARRDRDRSKLDSAIDGVAATRERVHAKVRVAERMLSKTMEAMSDIDDYCHQQEEMLNRAGYENHPGRARHRCPIPRRPSAREEVLKRSAANGVFDFRIEPQPNGWGKATVQGKILDLPPALSHLLGILASDSGEPCADKFVPWKSVQVLHQRMEKARGVPSERGGMRNLMYRLRKLFTDNDLTPFFITS